MTTSGTDISLYIDAPFTADIDERAFITLGRRVFETENAETAGDLTVRIVDNDTVRELNRRYRGIDEPTDVLSFGMDSSADDGGETSSAGDFVTPPGSDPQLGEVVIAYPTAMRQAEEAGHDVRSELDHLLVHGILHLLGYDHEAEAEGREMRSREEEVLGRRIHGESW